MANINKVVIIGTIGAIEPLWDTLYEVIVVVRGQKTSEDYHARVLVDMEDTHTNSTLLATGQVVYVCGMLQEDSGTVIRALAVDTVPNIQRQNGEPKNVYISGAMTGYVDNNFDQFCQAELALRETLGCNVVNPARASLIMGDGRSWQDYMEVDLALVRTCDAIVLLPGWENSRGAQEELAQAKDGGKKVYLLEDMITQHIKPGKAIEL